MPALVARKRSRPTALRGGRARYIHTDVRGSVLAKTDFDAQMSLPFQEAEYGPWGQTISVSALEAPTHQFVGFEPDPATGWYFMGARVYDPTLRRWLSPDPLMWAVPDFDANSGEQLNLYSYSRNSPSTAIDPSGLSCSYCSDEEVELVHEYGTFQMVGGGLFEFLGWAAELEETGVIAESVGEEMQAIETMEAAGQAGSSAKTLNEAPNLDISPYRSRLLGNLVGRVDNLVSKLPGLKIAEDILGAVEETMTKGKSSILSKEGGFGQAVEDFEMLSGSRKVEEVEDGKWVSKLKDGRSIILREESSDKLNRPTLEIQETNARGKVNNKVKVRYNKASDE